MIGWLSTIILLSAAVGPPVRMVLDGVVRVKALSGDTPAPGIPVSLDGHRVAITTQDGRYTFSDVPDGIHEVALALAELPADFDPGDAPRTRLRVQARRNARADFEVFPLVSLEGRVAGPEGSLEGILIRLAPGTRYTTTDDQGAFAFYNIHEGEYELALDPKTLPPNATLQSQGSARAVARLSMPVPPVQFSFTVTTPSKPIRKILDKK